MAGWSRRMARDGQASGQGEGRDPADRFWQLLLVASTIAALVSLLTTGLGLMRYVSWLLAGSLALAVQMGLFGLAWLIGSGQGRKRAWISALYFVTMLFSVTFSYVTLQGELTEEIRPAEARRRLLDASRQHLGATAQTLRVGIKESAELRLRLSSWLAMEQRDGWATSTCEEEEHCYLKGVCDRIGRRIERWEQESGRVYREGPGEKMIFGALETELAALEQIDNRLNAFGERWIENSPALEPDLDNLERLRRLDSASHQAPLAELEAVTCTPVSLPVAPAYLDHARDGASGDEQPSYAIADLLGLMRGERAFSREDYPTVFALALAVFIDLFVLVVAFGASTLREPNRFGDWLALDSGPRSFEDALESDIESWIDGALLHQRHRPELREGFVGNVLEALDYDNAGASLVPTSEEQRRFGHLMVQYRAAQMEPFVRYNRIGRRFRLEDWVVPALSRRLSTAGASH